MTSAGKRYQIIILEVKKNENNAVNNLYKLQDYFRRQGNNYEIICFEYGRITRTLTKTLDKLILKNVFSNPQFTLYQINQVWINNKLINSLYFEKIAFKSDLEKIKQLFKPKEE